MANNQLPKAKLTNYVKKGLGPIVWGSPPPRISSIDPCHPPPHILVFTNATEAGHISGVAFTIVLGNFGIRTQES